MGGTPGFEWVESRDTAEHLMMYRTASHYKELGSPNVNGAGWRNPGRGCAWMSSHCAHGNPIHLSTSRATLSNRVATVPHVAIEPGNVTGLN